MRIDGITVIVTGGASGLGLATAELLKSHGASVVIVDLPASSGEEIASNLGERVRFIAADVTSETEMERALDSVTTEIRGLIHCAGRGGDRTRVINTDRRPGSLDSFAEVVRVNLMGTYNVLRLVASKMSDNAIVDGDRGACILTSSVAAFDGQIGQTSYAASKAAIHGMTLVAARDLASWQIRVNSIAPGIFDTAMLGRLQKDIREGLASNVPHPRRFGRPEEFAELAVTLLQNEYINGETIRLDAAMRMPPR